jgi:hypothetical protein
MTLIKFIMSSALAVALAACSTVDTATRNTPLEATSLGAAGPVTYVRSYNVQSMNFVADSDLRVSESNGFYPFADVVWRGDPFGNRIEQLGEIFRTAADRGMAGRQGTIPVIVDVQLVRFHGVTERTRYSVGGVYDIKFNLTVRNAFTGSVLEPTRLVHVNLAAPGGMAAIVAEQQGQTEKVRVTDFMTQVLLDELTGQVTL